MGILDIFRARETGGGPETPRVAEPTRQRMEALIAEAVTVRWDVKLGEFASVDAFLSAPDAEQVEALHACFEYFHDHFRHTRGIRGGERDSRYDHQVIDRVQQLASRLLRKKLPCSSEDFAVFLSACGGRNGRVPYQMPNAVVGAVERAVAGALPDGELRASLEALLGSATLRSPGADTARLRERIERILAGKPRTVETAIEPVDAWTTELCAAIELMEAREKSFWSELIGQCMQATSAKPSQKWLRGAEAILERMGKDAFVRTFTGVLDKVGRKADSPVRRTVWLGHVVDGDGSLVSDRYSDCLRGFVWLTTLTETPELVATLGDAAERCFKKIPEHGPRAPKIGNACLYALSHCKSMDAVGQLSRIKTRARHASVRRQIEKSLETAAKNAGLSRDDLEDIAVPTCGLTEPGLRAQAVGDFEARLEITGVHSTTLTWAMQSGKVQKSVPAKVKSDHADELAAMKRSANEVKKLLPAQRIRIERMLLTGRTLPFGAWRERYLDHPLVGYLARRLLWRIGDEDGFEIVSCIEGTPRDIDGNTPSIPNDAPVRLWHPIDSPPDTVLAWRRWLESNGVTQPFKQAHREIYLLTDAERTTGTYSNRFAAHVLRQHQLNALFSERGWQYTLQGAWDSHNIPFINLDDLDWRVEFWVEPPDYTDDVVAGSGVFTHVLTDQVRFYRIREEGPQPLDRVPPTLFSELMRDVDLFVGVCSVGNDPTWQDGGHEGRYAGYWTSYAFGDLSESAKTRRDILERLVPKLKIAERCSLEEKFLVVRGDLRTYKIHLGSGNILMTPNDQYLCIVPDRSSASASIAGVMLPFEGDSLFSVILSKAFMLADDKRIEDRSIVSQINGR